MYRTILSRNVSPFLAILICVAVNDAASAQSRSLFGSRSLSNRSNSLSNRLSNFGNSSQTGNGFGNNPGSQQFNSNGNFQQNQFVGRQGGRQNRFVGSRGANRQNRQANNSNRFRRSNQRRRNRRSTNQNNTASSNASSSRPKWMMTTIYQIGFAHPRLEPSAVVEELKSQFSEIKTRRPELQDVGFDLDENHLLTLTGEVDSDEARQLAELLFRMSPGIRAVKNLLTVRSAS